MRRRRKGGRRGKGTIPFVQTAILAYPIWTAYKSVGLSKDFPPNVVYQLTGADINQMKWVDPGRGIGMALGLLACSTIGAKVANRVGANRAIKKITGNLVKLM